MNFLFLEPEEGVDVNPQHIETLKLYAVVMEDVILSASEAEHLKTCDECLEMIRLLVRQRLSKSATP